MYLLLLLFFLLSNQNKVFVYRGVEYERIGSFTQRLQTEYPSAQILTKNTPPDDSIVNGFDQCKKFKFLNLF